MMIFSGVTAVLMAVILPETYAPILMQQKVCGPLHGDSLLMQVFA